MQRYNPNELEKKWQKTWDDQQIYKADLNSSKPKYIAMSMFNYPSGAGIHIGHAMNYTISDVMARYKRQQGYESYHPVGWDAFGLPAENYAIKSGVSPQQSMATIIPSYHKQYKAMGWSNDWSKEISTHDPIYYKWTQWIFSQMYKHGLAYQDSRMQWWCTQCQTVLADEQVIDGKCWRHDGPDDPLVEKKEIKQWFFKITDYADELLEATDALDWSEVVKTAQKNWIGKSKGAEISFKIADHDNSITVFTTLPDTLFGATFMVLAPEHELVEKLTTKDQAEKVKNYVVAAEKKTEVERQASKDKSGVFTGSYAINPVNNEKIPVWVADYVLVGYGTGAIMAVPAHDERDNEFAKKYDLPIINVINPSSVRFDAVDATDFIEKKKVVALVQNNKGELLTINWGPKYGGRLFVGGTVEGDEPIENTAKREVAEETGYTDLEVIETGDETYYYKYIAYSKQEAHSIEGKFVFLKLKSDSKQEQKLDASEKDKFKVEWVSVDQASREVVEELHRYAYDKFISRHIHSGEGIMVNSGVYSGMSSSVAREQIVEHLANKPDDEPTFIQLTEPGIVKAGEPFVERDGIVAIVKHWQDDSYIVLKWKKVDWETLVTGGIEEGQTAEAAAIAEILEETGFQHAVMKKDLGLMHTKFYHVPKKQNRHGHVRGLYFELADGERKAVSRDEDSNHEVLWLSPSEMELFNLPVSHRFMWNKLMGRSLGVAKEVVNYKIRDWSVSRQRYWGAPIPIINCPKDGPVLVPDEDLPVVLPELDNYAPSGDGRSALGRATEWLQVTCPRCGGEAERETDTLDTYIDSSWYMLRYFDPTNEREIFGKAIVNKWMPIDFYNGGDHATAHMIYARFVTRFLRTLGLVDKPEPFKRFLFNGKVTASDGKMFSKSKGNGVDPLEIINSGYGADALRTYLMFAAPLDLWIRWDPQGVPGTFRFLNRVWNLVQEFIEAEKKQTDNDTPLKIIHPAILKVTQDLEDQKYNTAIATMMKATNDLYTLKAKEAFKGIVSWQFALDSLAAMIAPFAPHIADELWQQLGHTDSVQKDSWPVHEDKYLVSDSMVIVVQVNGKVRANITLPTSAAEAEIVAAAKVDDHVKTYLADKDIKKTVYIPGKLVNFVV